MVLTPEEQRLAIAVLILLTFIGVGAIIVYYGYLEDR